MSLTTPESIRRLQRKLYVKAKVEPTRRFHQLYDKVYRADILEHAYRLAKSQNGAPGVDGVSFTDIETWGEGPWLAALGKELHDKTYRPDPVRRVMIPKPGAANDRWASRPFGTGWSRPPPS
jgi:RNA-directed DNA polymerase